MLALLWCQFVDWDGIGYVHEQVKDECILDLTEIGNCEFISVDRSENKEQYRSKLLVRRLKLACRWLAGLIFRFSEMNLLCSSSCDHSFKILHSGLNKSIG